MILETDFVFNPTKNAIEQSIKLSETIKEEIENLFKWRNILATKDPNALTETELTVLDVPDIFAVQLSIDTNNRIYLHISKPD